jgi:hypothetical protein
MLEIYNEVITDLLNPVATNLQIREDIKRGCYVEDLSEHLIQNGAAQQAVSRCAAAAQRVPCAHGCCRCRWSLTLDTPRPFPHTHCTQRLTRCA